MAHFNFPFIIALADAQRIHPPLHADKVSLHRLTLQACSTRTRCYVLHTKDRTAGYISPTRPCHRRRHVRPPRAGNTAQNGRLSTLQASLPAGPLLRCKLTILDQ